MSQSFRFFKLWFLTFFIGMGLVVPQLSPYVLTELSLANPGLLFLLAQIAFPAGAFVAGYTSDRTLHIRYIALSLSLLASIAIIGFSLQVESSIYYIAAWSTFVFAIGGVIPLMNVAYLQGGNDRDLFGRARLYGTLGFLVPNAALLFVKVLPSQLIFWSGAFFALSTLVLFKLPPDRSISSDSEQQKISFSHLRALMSSKSFVAFLAIMLVFFIAFAPAEYVVSDYIANVDLWVQPIQLAWVLGTSLEIGFFFASPRLLKRFSPLAIVSFGFVTAIIRYGAMILMPLSTPVVLLQVLHGMHFGPAYLGAVLQIERSVEPAHLGAAQALYTIFSRATGTGIGAYFLGNLAADGAYISSFAVACGCAFLGVLGLWWFMATAANPKAESGR